MKKRYGKFVVSEAGRPDALEWIEEHLKQPGPNYVRVRSEAIGVDFIDTMIRSGHLPAALPTGIGYAAVGIVEDVGLGVEGIAVGDRVAYLHFVAGSYAEQRNVPEERVFKLPDQSMSPVTAAGALFRGLTAWYLADELWNLKRGDTALVHAAAGGVGLILTQWLAHRGITVVGTVRERWKAQTLREYGCRYPVVISEEDFVAKVKEVTDGKGASVVYESVGAATFDKSLECVRKFGLIASYGSPSGEPELSLMTLRAKGSIFVTRPTISHYAAEAEAFRRGASELFRLVGDNVLRIHTSHVYPLRDASQAHAALESGRTTGSVVLKVGK